MPNLNELKLAKELIRFQSITPRDAGAINFLKNKLKSLGFKCKVLEFRDKAFDTYFKSQDYLSMVKKTFGEQTVSHIEKMSSHKLKRKHNFEKVNY